MSLQSTTDSESLLFPADGNVTTEGDRYLGCHLVPNMTLLLPVQFLTEVLTIPIHQVTPIPMMGPWVMGVYNWRGEVLWVVDLGQLLGLTPWYQQGGNLSNHNLLVIRNQDEGQASHPGAETQRKLGLVVSQVQDITVIPPSEIRPPNTAIAAPALAPYLKGYTLSSQGQLQSCLDTEAIFSMLVKR